MPSRALRKSTILGFLRAIEDGLEIEDGQSLVNRSNESSKENCPKNSKMFISLFRLFFSPSASLCVRNLVSLSPYLTYALLSLLPRILHHFSCYL